MNRTNPLIYLVIPFYNEEENIARVIKTIANSSGNLDRVCLIGVDHNSTDKSPEIFREPSGFDLKKAIKFIVGIEWLKYYLRELLYKLRIFETFTSLTSRLFLRINREQFANVFDWTHSLVLPTASRFCKDSSLGEGVYKVEAANKGKQYSKRSIGDWSELEKKEYNDIVGKYRYKEVLPERYFEFVR